MSTTCTSTGAPELFEVLCGTPRCRAFRTTGMAHECRPHLPSANTKRVLPWMWFWRVRISSPRLFTLLAVAELITSCVIFVELLLYASVAAAVGFLVAFSVVFTAPMLYVAPIAEFSLRLREGLSYVMGKAAQAQAQWVNARNLEYAKHVFYEHSVTARFKLVVLNDGTSLVSRKRKGQRFSGMFVEVDAGQRW